MFLSYFGSGSPAHEGIAATRIADGYFDLRTREVLPEMTGGIYCLSATMFQQPYTLVRHGWTTAHEQRYAELRGWVDAWRAGRASETARAARPGQPRIEATPRDTERPAQPPRRPDHPVLRDEGELHVDSFAK